ncbi:MAG: restriction endonuclease subunit S [Candidatus Thiodiazotropha sp.]
MAKELVHSFEGELPEGWATATIGDLISPEGVFIDGDWVESKDQDPNGDVRLIQLADIADGYYKDKSERFLTKEKALKLNCTFLKKGDVLIARMPDPLGRACIFPGDAKESVTVVDVCVVRTGTEVVNNKWLMYWVNSPRFRNTIASLQSGTTRKRISRGNLATITFPVPPSEQQKRIVAKIEELFSHIDAGIEALKKAKQLLKQYRQSVLKAAVTGELTKEWREANKDKLEPASQLLERILKERRQKWEEQQLEQFKAKGKMPKDDKWKEKYKERLEPEWPELGELPEGWAWITIDQLASDKPRSIQSGPFGSNLKHSEFQETGKLVVGIDNVREGFFSMGSENRISEKKYAELEKYAARPGDVLITVMATIGRTCVIPEDLEPTIITKHVYRITVERDLVLPDYLNMCLYGAPSVVDQIFSQTIGQTRPGLNGAIIKDLCIPIPTTEEQRLILNKVNEKSESIKRLEPELDAQLFKAERNKQSVLASAFSGSLKG